MPKVGGRRKKAKSHKQATQEDQKLIPKTFIFKKGQCSNECKELVKDMRKCFYPNTSMKLQDSKKTGIKTYLRAAKYYHVTHLLTLQQRNDQTIFRIIRVGGGEMRFRVLNYCGMKEVFKNGGQAFSTAFKQPLLVLNNFNAIKQTERIGRALQQLFSPLNIQKLKPNSIKRVISFTYQPNKKCIYFRHYKIIVRQGGINSMIKNIIHSKKLPNLSQFKSFSDYIFSTQSQTVGNQQQQTVKLEQMGPRMKLKFLTYAETTGLCQDLQEQQQQQMEQQPPKKQNEIEQQQQQQQ